MILVHVQKISERWKYTLDFIFGIRAIEIQLTESAQDYENYPDLKFSFEKLKIGILLNETGITKRSVSKGYWNGADCLAFEGISDPLSSLFFVLTRMEEYNHKKKDNHNRFEGKESLQYQFGWLEQCICDRWAETIIKEVEQKLETQFTISSKKVQLIPTFDIDNTFAYRMKYGKRKFLSIAKDLIQFNNQRRKERKLVLAGKQQDPYDTFALIKSISEKFTTRIFWLIGSYGGFDKNITIEEVEHSKLVQQLSASIEIGIHPSYASNNSTKLVKIEKDKLEKVIGKSVIISRQHFLKLNFPSTYQNLIAQEIQQDFSMGFADTVGFRNGTAHAFPWFDISIEKKTSLLIRPFVYMDGTLNQYLELSPEVAKIRIKQLHEEVCAFGGDFIVIWHNETIGEYGIWKGWRSVLDYTLSLNIKD